jgi:EAL domain-containing protein (putative c-di-GMP-specific phosphodiesterase class I)/CheY-like chemotaxis protein
MVHPSEFIPIAEKSGLIVPIGAWAIDRACAQIHTMREIGLPDVKIAVNVSARQFLSGDLESTLSAAIRRHKICPASLQLELTESMLMEDPEESVIRLQDMKRFGVRLSIDDFGTGYSSLAYLSRYPMDELKIDRSFVVGIVTDPASASISRSVIDLAHRMQLSVVAEGVETAEQMGYLRKNRCDEMQGFYFSPPVTAEQFGEMLRQNRSLEMSEESEGKKSILVIDDEKGSLAAIIALLSAEGYRVLRAISAVDGMNKMALHDVQVILSGRQTSDMGGQEFLTRIGDLHPEAVRIIISDNNDLEPLLQAVNSGIIYRCMLMPCSDEQLRERIREAFNYQEMRRSTEG